MFCAAIWSEGQPEALRHSMKDLLTSASHLPIAATRECSCLRPSSLDIFTCTPWGT